MTSIKLGRSVWVAIVSFGLAVMPSAGASEPTPDHAAANSKLTIKVVGARNANGKIYVALFQDPTGFPEKGSAALRREQADIDRQTLTAQVVFRDVPQGVYAVSVLHDENSNGKLDKNFFGIPEEGYGASNNPGKRMRAPNFDEAKFSMSSTDQTLQIKLVY